MSLIDCNLYGYGEQRTSEELSQVLGMYVVHLAAVAPGTFSTTS